MAGSDLLGLIAGALTTFAFVPQVVRTWRRRSASDLSLAWIVTFVAGIALWLVYGVVVGARPIIVANVATLALVLVILYFKLRYG